MKEDIDIIRELSYPDKRFHFWLHLYTQRQHIIEVVSQHLNLQQSDFTLGEVTEWIHGSFNACIPIHILQSPRTSDLPRRAIIRFPLPYKVGEAFRHGNVDEKLRSEAATYIWMQQNCPNVAIPRLFGFGFPGKQSVRNAAPARPHYIHRASSSLQWAAGRCTVVQYGLFVALCRGYLVARSPRTFLTAAAIWPTSAI